MTTSHFQIDGEKRLAFCLFSQQVAGGLKPLRDDSSKRQIPEFRFLLTRSHRNKDALKKPTPDLIA